MKKPNAIGIATKTTPIHSAPIPDSNAVVGSELPPISISASGKKLAKADNAPKQIVNSPGQPQHNAVITVIITPVVFLSTFSS
jgi:hypothetical protein